MGGLGQWPAKVRVFGSFKYPVPSSEMMSLQEEVQFINYARVEGINGMNF